MAAVNPVRDAADASRSALAHRLVDEAADLLAEHGIDALTLRRLASRANTSTMAVYTLFGDKAGLLAAMHREGFSRLGESSAAAAAEHDDPLAALTATGEAYRAFALANPHLYQLMFGGAAPGFRPDARGEVVAEAAYRPMLSCVQRCLDAGVLVGQPAETISFHLWTVAHGVMSLELAGYDADDAAAAEARYTEAMIFSALPFLPH